MKSTYRFIGYLLCHSLMVVGIFQTSFSQGRKELDSLFGALKLAKSDTQRVEIQLNLTLKYTAISPDSGLTHGYAALELSRKINWRLGEIKSLNALGFSHFRKGSYTKALQYCFESVKLCKEIQAIDPLAVAYNTIGITYKELGDLDKAEYYIGENLKINESRKNINALPGSYLSMGLIHEQKKRYQEALANNEKAGQAARMVNNRTVIAYAYSNSGICYQKLKNYEKALENHFKALQIEEELEDVYGTATEFGSISDAFRGLYLQKQENGLHSPNLIDSAITYASKGIELCKTLGNYSDLVNIYFSLYENLKLKNQHQKALEVYESASRIKDSLFSAENQKKLREFEARQQTEIKEKEIQLIESEKKLQRNYYLLGSAILLLSAIGIYSRLHTIRKNKKLLEHKNDIITAEKQRSDDLLKNILPSEVAEELKTKGHANARQFDCVTVMFTDFKGFTGITEQLSPVELVNEIDICFKEYDRIMEKYGIEKIKTIGDSYMCAGGIPIANQTHADNVVSAALEIREFMKHHMDERIKTGRIPFEIRIGVHSGPVIAGIVGAKKFAYDIWGDTVNIASRMESSGETGKVNISGITYELIKDRFNCIYRGKIEAKNKGTIDMYFVEARRPEHP